MAQSSVSAFSTPSQWQLGGELIDQGTGHPALKAVTDSWDEVLKVLAEVQQFSANLKKIGVGRTEDPTLIVARLVPALECHAALVARVAHQLEEKLR
jgi:hypothetical protein